MSFFGRVVRAGASAVKTGSAALRLANKVPLVSTVAKAVPGLGTALTVASAASTAYNLLGGKKTAAAGLPAIPGGMPALPGQGAPAIVGDRSIFRDDPNVAEAIKPFAIAQRNLRQAYRSPLKGYVVVRDAVGDPIAVPKWIAKAYFGWKPARKPPISVTEWNAIQTADRAVKKVRKAMTTISRVDKGITHGKVTVHQKKKSK